MEGPVAQEVYGVKETWNKFVSQSRRSPKKLHRQRSAELGLTPSSIRRKMKQDLNLFPYHITTAHKSTDGDEAARVAVWEMLQQKMEANPNRIRDAWFYDEAHFHVNGAVNSHNNIFWRLQHPDEVEEKLLKGRKVTAFVAVSDRGVLEPYWFEDKNGRTVTINQERYRSIVNAFHEDLKQSMSTAAHRRQWFMQEGATLQTAN